MRINKYLASCGLGSRRNVEKLIADGLVVVNGKVITDLSTDITEKDKVYFKNKLVTPAEEKVYIMLNKPKCYITSMKDEKNRKIVIDLLKGCKQKVFPVGRLDYNTQGLLLLTNDGNWANEITHPSKHIPKTYEVLLKHELTNKQMNKIRNGIIIDNRRTLPAKVSIVDKLNDFYITHITIFEGRNREIRKIFEHLGLTIYGLKRIKIGELELGNLEEGKYRYLNLNEINSVFYGG
ncbi:MAG: pseudouridine synthase [Christensenellales bacterium]